MFWVLDLKETISKNVKTTYYISVGFGSFSIDLSVEVHNETDSQIVRVVPAT